MKVFIVGFFLLSACASKPIDADQNWCQKNLSDQENLRRCHDQNFEKLKTDPGPAMLTLEQLCNQNHLGRACSNVAYNSEEPVPGSKVDLKMANEYYTKGCDLGDGIACMSLADLIFQGRGTAPNPAKGVQLLQKSCDLNYGQGCLRVAMVVLRGKLLPANPEEVTKLMEKACDLGDAMGCHDLGYRYMDGLGTARDQVRALDVIGLSCEKGFPRGCGSLGTFYMMGVAEGGVDYAQAYELLQRGCAGLDGPSCSNLGYMIETGKGVAADPVRAAQFYIQACSKGDLMGCGNLGVLQAEGRGVNRDDRGALPNLERACSDEVPEACRYMAIFHEEGRAGLPKAQVTANFYRKKACQFGDELSCSKIAVGFESLCAKEDTLVLACMTGAKRMVSICSHAQNLLYRFGRKNKIELEWSGAIKFLAESWANGEKNSLEFTNGTTRYEVGEEISKNTDPPTKKVKVTVSERQKKNSPECHVPILGTLNSDSVKKAHNLSAN